MSALYVRMRCSAMCTASVALALGLAGCNDDYHPPSVTNASSSSSSSQQSIGSAPVITAQPQNVAVAGEGTRPVFTVAGTSDAGPISYQWLSNGNDIPGATSASFAPPPLQLSDVNVPLSVRLTNSAGTTVSSSATIAAINERFWNCCSGNASPLRSVTAIVDSNGHTHILGITGDTSQGGVRAQVKLVSTDATTPNQFQDPANATLQPLATLTDASASITAAKNSAGNVMVTWHQNGIVGAALYTPGPDLQTVGSWTLLPTRINSFSATSARDPAVVAVGNNAFEFVWREQLAANAAYNIMGRRYTINTNTLSTASSLEDRSEDMRTPKIVADTAGNILAAFEVNGVGAAINRRVSSASTWSGNGYTFVDSAGYRLETLKANAEGKAILLTSDRAGTAHASRLDLAATTPLIVGGEAVANAYGSAPDANIDSTGKIRVYGVSVNSTNGNSQVFEWTYTPTGSSPGWGSASAVSGVYNAHNFLTTGYGLYNPVVSEFDAAGNWIVTWERVNNTVDPGQFLDVRARRYVVGTGWRTELTGVYVPSVLSAGHSIAMASDGSASIVAIPFSGGYTQSDFRSSNSAPN